MRPCSRLPRWGGKLSFHRVPRQYSTGGKTRLGRITKQGDKYLRMLLIHGTRAVLAALRDKNAD